MASSSFTHSLTALLSPESRVLSDESSTEFKASMDRWSNYGLQVPSAIVQPATENDVVVTIKELVAASIPFTPASGGHSSFSSIGKDGVIVDLSRFTGVEVDTAKCLATIKGGTLMKELQTALHPHKQFAAVGSGSTVGVIPFYIGGGISSYSALYGYGCENIVAARLVTAQGDLVQVTETDPELLWGISGAGQFLGLITQLTIKTRPYSLLGNELGQRIIGTFGFTTDKLDAVCTAMIPLMESKEYMSAGHMTIALAPPDFQHQAILVSPQMFTTAEKAAKLFQPLVDIGPIMQVVRPSTFETHSDHMAWACVTGSFKRFTQNGMTGFSLESVQELIKLHAELVSTCPDAARSSITVEWHTHYNGPSLAETAFGLDDIRYWLNVFSWYEDPKNHDYVESIDKKAQQIARVKDKEEEFVSYTNTCREDPLEWRYKGQDRIARLKALKKKWDPKGVFTKELL